MKKKIGIFLLAAILLVALSGCAANSSDNAEGDSATSDVQTEISEVTLDAGVISVYDMGDLKIHAYATGDALGDECYIIESSDALVGIEAPSFTQNLHAWKAYIEELGKPMDDIFICSHATGASYIEGLTVYGTQGAQDAIKNGSTFETTQGLYETFGDDFHGGSDMIQINKVVPEGSVTVTGVAFKVIDRGDTYDLEIPEANSIYTHMLGKTSHSILVSKEQMDAMIAILKDYQTAGYDLILSAHSAPEGQDAVTEKIAYLEKAEELTGSCSSADEFITAMKEAFPDYTGDNYLEMSAGFLYPSAQ